MGKPATTYPEKVATGLEDKLDHLAQNPKGLQLKEMVARLRPKIEAVQQAGYSIEDIVHVFNEMGVVITVNTLKQYLREVKAEPKEPKLLSTTESAIPTVASAQKEKTVANAPPVPATPVPTAKPKASKPQSVQTVKPVEKPIEKNEKSESEKIRLTNTNEQGFLEMRPDDEL